MASAAAEPSSGPAIASFASRQALCGISRSVISAPMNGMKSGAETGSPCRFASSTCPISWTNSNTTSPIPNHQPPIQTYTAADTHIEKRNLNLSRTTPNLARNAPIAAIGAQILRKRPRQSKPFGWIGSYWRHSCGYCSMPAIVPTGIGRTAAAHDPRPIQSSPPSVQGRAHVSVTGIGRTRVRLGSVFQDQFQLLLQLSLDLVATRTRLEEQE